MRSRGITLRSDRFHERRTAPSIYEIKNVDSFENGDCELQSPKEKS